MTSQPNPRAVYRAAVITDPSLSDGAVRLYDVLDDHARNKGHCFPHHSTLAREMGVKEREVRYRLAELVKAGHVSVERRQRGLTYHLTWNPDRHNCAAQNRSDRHNCASLTGTTVPPRATDTLYLKLENETEPFAMEEEPNPPAANVCLFCHGAGYVRRPSDRCGVCLGSGKGRKQA